MARKTPCPPPLPLVTISSPLPSDNIKPLFWTKVTPSSKNTIWHRVSECQKIVSFNEENFVTLFQKKGETHRMVCSSPVSPLRILNDKKYQAIQILLRNISWEDIMHLMESLNYVKQCSFDVGCLSNVATMITVNELKKLRCCSPNSLEQPERLVLQLFEIENFREKVTCLQCMSQYHDTIPTIKKQIQAFGEAFMSLYKPNEKLCQVLALILTAGNKMNASSTIRRNAKGFKLDILPELKNVRSSDGSSNLLQFIVQSYINSQSLSPDSTNTNIEFPLPKDSKLIPAASVNLLDLKILGKNLESDLGACKKFCSQIHDSGNFYKETVIFIDESVQDLAEVSRQLKDLERLFDDVMCFYSLDGRDCSTTSEEFLQYWISFIQSFSKYWDRAVQGINKPTKSSYIPDKLRLVSEISPLTLPIHNESRKRMPSSSNVKLETDV